MYNHTDRGPCLGSLHHYPGLLDGFVEATLWQGKGMKWGLGREGGKRRKGEAG